MITVATSVAAATWFVRNAIGEVSATLKVHVIEEASERTSLEKRVVRIEDAKKRTRRQ